MEKLKVHALLAALTGVIGALLVVYMITVEGEPGALPLLLIVLGGGGYAITRTRMRSHYRRPQ